MNIFEVILGVAKWGSQASPVDRQNICSRVHTLQSGISQSSVHFECKMQAHIFLKSLLASPSHSGLGLHSRTSAVSPQRSILFHLPFNLLLRRPIPPPQQFEL